MVNSPEYPEPGSWSHDGHELELMRSGKKPLAFFCSSKSDDTELMVSEFKNLVDSSLVTMEIRTTEISIRQSDGSFSELISYYSFFARRNEEWRIDLVH